MVYGGYPGAGGGGRLLLFILSLVFGLYFINIPFNFVSLPVFSEEVGKWIIFFGGVLLIIAGLGNLFRRRY